VLFTDESRVELHGKPNKQNIRIRSANPDAAKFVGTVKHDPVTVQVFGGITWRGMTQLHILEADQRITGDFYRRRMLPKYKTDVQELYGDDAKTRSCCKRTVHQHTPAKPVRAGSSETGLDRCLSPIQPRSMTLFCGLATPQILTQ